MMQSYWLSRYEATFLFIYFQIWNKIADIMQFCFGLLHEIDKKSGLICRKVTPANRGFLAGD